MRKKSKLHFTSEQHEKTKRFRAFIVAFAAFVLVLGSVSTLIFMKSINFDLHNLLNASENPETTTEQTTAAENTLTVRNVAVLLVCCDTEDQLTLLAVVRADAEQNRITACALDTDAAVSSAGDMSFQTVFEKNGLAGLKNAVSSAYQVQIDRYVKLTESNLKKAVSAVGDVSLQIPEAISYRSSDFSLYLDAGEQTLTGDLLVKYLHFTDTNGKSQATAALVQATLQSLSGKNREKQFNTLFNLSDSNFSIVDITDSNGLVNVYVAMRGTVFVEESI